MGDCYLWSQHHYPASMRKVNDDVRLDEGVTALRALLFPFFDRVEKTFILGLVVAETGLIAVLSVPNGWVIPIGSYVGMLGVAWTALPSELEFPRENESMVKLRMRELGMREITENCFVPALPRLLRWPRNVVKVRSNGLTTLTGPRALLTAVKRRVEQR